LTGALPSADVDQGSPSNAFHHEEREGRKDKNLRIFFVSSVFFVVKTSSSKRDPEIYIEPPSVRM